MIDTQELPRVYDALDPFVADHPCLVGKPADVVVVALVNELADAYTEIGTLQTTLAAFAKPSL